MEQRYDIIIIGGGPAGATAALYAAQAGRRVLVLDKPGRDGSLEASEKVMDYPGVPGPVSGPELLKIIRDQARAVGATFISEVVIAAQLPGETKSVFTAEGGLYESRAVIIATGALERAVKIPGEEKYWGLGVSGCTTCDAFFYEGKTAIVVGSDDYAAAEAMELARYAAKVYFIIPQRPLISGDILIKLLEHPNVELHQEWTLEEILGNEEAVHSAGFRTPEGEKILDADGIFLYLNGDRPTSTFLQGQLPLDESGAIRVHADQSTDLPLIYAAGNVTAHPYRQPIIAAAEGCTAALAIEHIFSI